MSKHHISMVFERGQEIRSKRKNEGNLVLDAGVGMGRYADVAIKSGAREKLEDWLSPCR